MSTEPNENENHHHQPQQQKPGVFVGGGERVLSLLLLHDPQLLSIRDLGALSITSKSLQKQTEPHWKNLWERYVEAGAEMKPRNSTGLLFRTWCGENALLSCFADHKLAISCGYKHAAGCLKSKTCFKCGDMASDAHPLTLTRLCKGCGDQEEYWFIPKSKAKEAFLLGEADLRALRSASHPIKTFAGAYATSTIFLLSDVVNASLAKHGGVDGLQAALMAKKATAMEKYSKSQLTNKPQKKKPKVTNMSDRPTDNLRSLKGWYSKLPIGVIYNDDDGTTKMTHAVECSDCNVRGMASDIEKHTRLVHGGCGEPWGQVKPLLDDMMPSSPNGGNALAVLSVCDELKHAITNATKVRGHVETYPPTDWFGPPELEWLSCDMTFGDDDNGGGCKIMVEMKVETMTEIDIGEYRILAQSGGSKKLPLELLTAGFGEYWGDGVFADKKTYRNLIEALGLDGTTVTPSQLLAALIMESLPAPKFVGAFEWRMSMSRDNPGHAILMDACELLKDAFARSNTGKQRGGN